MSDLPPVLLGIQVLLYFYPYLNSGHRPGRWAEEWKEQSRRLLDKISTVPQLEVFVAKVSLDYVLDFVRSGAGRELAERFEESLKMNRLSVLPRRSHLISPSDIPFHELKLAMERGFAVITHERSEYLIPTDASSTASNTTVVQTVEEFLAWLDVTVQPVEPAPSDLSVVPSRAVTPTDRSLHTSALAPTRPTSDRPAAAQQSDAIAIALSVFLGHLIKELEQLGMDQQEQLAKAHQYLRQLGHASTAEAQASSHTPQPSILTAIENLGGSLSITSEAGLWRTARQSNTSGEISADKAEPASDREQQEDSEGEHQNEFASGPTEAKAAAELIQTDPVNYVAGRAVDQSQALDQSEESNNTPHPVNTQANTLIPEAQSNSDVDPVPSPVVAHRGFTVTPINEGSNDTKGATENTPDPLLVDLTTPVRSTRCPPSGLTILPEADEDNGGLSTGPTPLPPDNSGGSTVSDGEESLNPSSPIPGAGDGSNPDANQPLPLDPIPNLPQSPRDNAGPGEPVLNLVEPEGHVSYFDGDNGRFRVNVKLSDHIVIKNFGGVGADSAPPPDILKEIDTLILEGAGLTAKNMLLEQVGKYGEDLLITFLGVPDTTITLKDFDLQLLDNLPFQSGIERVGNIRFDGQSELEDAFDVIAEGDPVNFQVFRPNVTTFLNGSNNTARGRDASNDVIHGLEGDDRLLGLSGDDTLRGGDGDDLLDGGAGDDLLYGGTGRDRFLLAPNAGTDTIYGFELGQDWLQLADGINPSQIEFFPHGSGGTSIKYNSQTLAILNGIQTRVLLGDPGSLVWASTSTSHLQMAA